MTEAPMMTARRLVIAGAALIAVAALVLAASMWLLPGRGDEGRTDVAVHAARVHYASGGTRAWGTLCKLPGGGYVSVHHVTVNGTPVIGPTDAVTAYDEADDWSILGVDPATLDAAAVPVLLRGDPVTILGYPARDRDGEVIPGTVYIEDVAAPMIWIELHDAAPGVEAEGVVGGLSGSCVLDEDGRVAGVVHANGFSRISGTTNTWALVVPLRHAIRAAQGLEAETADAPLALVSMPRPVIERGRWGVR